MKRILFSLMAGAAFLMSGCTKNEGCTNVTADKEDAAMVAYMTTINMTGTKHSTGVYYEIELTGAAAKPTSNSRVYVRYTGKTFNGNIFDSQSAAANTGFQLYNLIAGWQVGIPLIGKGGKIRLVIPSSLGYGCNGAGDDIPANSPLYFDIELVEFQ